MEVFSSKSRRTIHGRIRGGGGILQPFVDERQGERQEVANDDAALVNITTDIT